MWPKGNAVTVKRGQSRERSCQYTCRGPDAPAHRDDVYFRTADFFGGAVFFPRDRVGALRASLTALPAWNRTALLAAIWMVSPVCGFPPGQPPVVLARAGFVTLNRQSSPIPPDRPDNTTPRQPKRRPAKSRCTTAKQDDNVTVNARSRRPRRNHRANRNGMGGGTS